MATVIQWGTIQYNENQVVTYSPGGLSGRFAPFERLNKKAVQFAVAPPLRRFEVELYFHPGNSASPSADYVALESRFTQAVAVSADLIVYGENQGKFVLGSLEGSYSHCAGNGKPTHVTVKVAWIEDVPL